MKLNGNVGRVAEYIQNNTLCRPSDMSNFLDISPSNLTPLLRKLEKNGIAEVSAGETLRERLYKIKDGVMIG